MSELTADELRESIVPDCDELTGDDLLTGPITVTITGVKRGDKARPIVVELEGQKPFKPCKTCRRILIGVYGDRPSDWIGHRLTLWRNPEVIYSGLKMGGVRVSHMTGIERDTSFTVTVSRGKKEQVIISPIVELKDSPSVYAYRKRIQEAETVVALKAVGFLLKTEPEPLRAAMRADYEARQKALSLDLEDLAGTMP